MNKLLRQTGIVDGPLKQQQQQQSADLNSGNVLHPAHMAYSLGDTIRFHNQDILTAGVDLYAALTVSLLNYLDMNERYRHRICTQFGLDLLVLRPEARIGIVQGHLIIANYLNIMIKLVCPVMDADNGILFKCTFQHEPQMLYIAYDAINQHFLALGNQVERIQVGIHVHAHMLLQHAAALDAIIRPRLYSTTPLFAAVSSCVRASLPQSPLLTNNLPYPKVTSIGHGIFFSDGLAVFLQEQVYQHIMLNMDRFEELHRRQKLTAEVGRSHPNDGNKKPCKCCGKQFAVPQSTDQAGVDSPNHHLQQQQQQHHQQGLHANNSLCCENGSTAKVGGHRLAAACVCQHDREIGNCSDCSASTVQAVTECATDMCNECSLKARVKLINSSSDEFGIGNSSLYEHCEFLKRLNYYAIDIEHLILKALSEVIRCAIVVLYSTKQQKNCKFNDDSHNKENMLSIYIPHRPQANLTKNLLSGGVELICLAKNEYNQHFDEAVVSIGSAGWYYLQTHIMSQVQSEQGQYERENSNHQTNTQSAVNRRVTTANEPDSNSIAKNKLPTPGNLIIRTKAHKSGIERCKGTHPNSDSLDSKHSQHDDSDGGINNFDGVRKSDMKHRLLKTKEKLKNVFGKSKDINATGLPPTLTENIANNYNFEADDPHHNAKVNQTTSKAQHSNVLEFKSFQQNHLRDNPQITYDNIEPNRYNEIKQYPNQVSSALMKKEKEHKKSNLQSRFIKTDNMKVHFNSKQSQQLFVPATAPTTINAIKEDTTCKDSGINGACSQDNCETTFPRISSAISALSIPTINANGANKKLSPQLNCAERNPFELNNIRFGADVEATLGDNSPFDEPPFLMTSNAKNANKDFENKTSEFMMKSKSRDASNANPRQFNANDVEHVLNINTSSVCSIGNPYVADKKLTILTKGYASSQVRENPNLNNTSIPIARIVSSFPADMSKDANRADTGLRSSSTDNDSPSVVNDVYQLMQNSQCLEERNILEEHGNVIMEHLQNTELEDHEKTALMRALLGKALTDNDKDKIKNIIGLVRKQKSQQDKKIAMLSGRQIKQNESCTFGSDQPNVHEANESNQYRLFNPDDKQVKITNAQDGHRQSTLILLENLSKTNCELFSMNSAYGVAKGSSFQRSGGTASEVNNTPQFCDIIDSYKTVANEYADQNKNNNLPADQNNVESHITKQVDKLDTLNNDEDNQKVCELNQRVTQLVNCEGESSLQSNNGVTNSCFNAIAASMIIASQNNPYVLETLEHRLRLKPFTFSTSTNFEELVNLITKRLQRLTLREWKRNKYRYVNYMYGFEFEKEIEKFSETGQCCSQLENAIPLAVANSVGVEIQIITSLREYPLLQVTPDRFTTTKKRMIVLMLALDQCEGSSAIYSVAVPKDVTDLESVASSKLSKSNKSVTFSETTEVRTFERSEEEKKDILEWQIERGRNKKDKNGNVTSQPNTSPDYRMAMEKPDLDHLKHLNGMPPSMQLLAHSVPQSVQNHHVLSHHANYPSNMMANETMMNHYINSLNTNKLPHQLVPNSNNSVMHLPDGGGGGKHILSAFPIGGYVPNFTSYFPLLTQQTVSNPDVQFVNTGNRIF